MQHKFNLPTAKHRAISNTFYEEEHCPSMVRVFEPYIFHNIGNNKISKLLGEKLSGQARNCQVGDIIHKLVRNSQVDLKPKTKNRQRLTRLKENWPKQIWQDGEEKDGQNCVTKWFCIDYLMEFFRSIRFAKGFLVIFYYLKNFKSSLSADQSWQLGFQKMILEELQYENN